MEQGIGMDPKDQTHCGKCNRVWNKSGSLMCSCCHLFIHKTCTDLSTEQFDLIMALYNKKMPYFWACFGCGKAMDRITASMMEVQARLGKVENTQMEQTKKGR